jgi:hypothetical protein
VAGGALFGIGGAILAAPVVAAGRDLYRYIFMRLNDGTAQAARDAVFRLTPPPPAEPAEPAAQGA